MKDTRLRKTQLPCCAMCFMSNTSNDTTERQLLYFIDKLKQEAFSKPWKYDNRDSGERTILTVTMPGEEELEKLLESMKFEKLGTDFNRRFGYPEGKLTLWTFKF